MQKNKLLSIECARGIAAILVVFYHAARHMQLDIGFLPGGAFSKFGHAGVDFFFVLSGFIIYFVHEKDIGSYRAINHYIKKRFSRIYPLFWLSVALSLLLTFVSSTKKMPDIDFLLYWLTLMPNSGDVGVAWSLQHEILFYIIFSFSIINHRVGKVILFIWLLFILATQLYKFQFEEFVLLQRLSSFYNIEFFFGMLAAYLVKRRMSCRRGLLFAFGTIAFLGFGIAENVGIFDGYANPARIAYGFSSLAIVIGLAELELKSNLQPPLVLIELGAASYSIYLFHLPLIGIAYKILEYAKIIPISPILFIYGLIVSVGVFGGILVSRFIEYRLTNYCRQMFLNISDSNAKYKI